MSPGPRITKGLDFMLKDIAPKGKTPESRVVTQESGLKSQASVVITPEKEGMKQESVVATQESGILTQDSGVTTQESRKEDHEAGIKTQDSGVMTHESVVITPEKEGMRQESIVKTQESGIRLQESGVTSHDSGDVTQDASVQKQDTRSRNSAEKKKSRVRTPESSVVPDNIIDQAVAQALQSPKISLYSPLLLAVLESQQLSLLNRKEVTLLNYRKATKARELVEKALMDSYPDLCEKILKRLNEGNGKS